MGRFLTGLGVFLAVSASFSGCVRKKALTANLEINLYTGIPGVVRLGDTESQLQASCQRFSCEKEDVAADSGLDKISVNYLYRFRDLGVKAYVQRGQVALIEIQDPFKGIIQNKRLAIFSLAPPPNTSWETLLAREFGEPNARAAGGRLGSDSMVYSWGDISYNRQGPNEIALYREPSISSYRQRNFGREIRLFP